MIRHLWVYSKLVITRRQLLSRSVQIGGGLAMRSALAARVSQMRFGFMTYQWGIDWDVPTLIANCTKAEAYAVELRTSAHYAHGVELTLSSEDRREVRKKFADSPVQIIGLSSEDRREVRKKFADSPVQIIGVASAERFDSPDPDRLGKAIGVVKGHRKLD